ncbi:hypothetical protein IMZ11_29150 [Microtetraspora sp. AC03309]|uniref:hypothetical protein n=1 Tax=Microtetraspora sp. AC03309 TaxID=2779376 RepID=UPI001E2BF838|nr:hypothetical protein [Microtetraspora sp. AC03309]MCC5579702.1 hypothetical protein [Microtetraspora sp. AC03309]
MAKGNKPNHRRFGNIRQLPSGRYQVSYLGPDGRRRTGSETYERKGDAERALTLIEAKMISGEWTDPDRGKIKLKDYAETWISQRPGLRPRTVDLYVAAQEAHHAVSRRRPARQAVYGDDSAVAGRPARQRGLGLDGGQGVPAATGGADDGG